jgi:hypothetical protein
MYKTNLLNECDIYLSNIIEHYYHIAITLHNAGTSTST